MKDSDPRPMPAEVARAYRDPLELGELFATDVFTNETRLQVRDELLRRLLTKYGNAELPSGSKFVTVTQRVTKFKKNPWKSIELMMSVPEYGGKDAVKLELAHVMQPYWAACRMGSKSRRLVRMSLAGRHAGQAAKGSPTSS